MDEYGPREGLLEQLDALWGERGMYAGDLDVRNGPDADYVAIATIDKDNRFTKVMFEWPHQSSAIVTKIFQAVSDQKETYICPALFKANTSTKKENFKKSHTLWVDFDGNAPEEWDEKKHGIVQPSVRIISSEPGRQHHYWILDEPVYDYLELENRNRTLAYELGADIGGWDCNQLLRPTQTVNYGYAKSRKPHDVITEELVIDRKYSLNSFGVNEALVTKPPEGLDTRLVTLSNLMMFNKWNDKLADDWDHIPEKGYMSDALVSMAYQAAELDWTDESIYSLIHHMDEKIGKYTGRRDRIKRLTDIVSRVRMKRPVAEEVEPDEGLDEITFFSQILSHREEFEWLMQDVISRSAFGLLVSPPGVGKTTIGLRLGMAIAAGNDEFLDHTIVRASDGQPRKVMFFSLEMDKISLSKIFTDMNLDSDELDRVNKMAFYATGRPLYLDRPEARKLFEDLIKRQKPDLIIMDSLSKIMIKPVTDDNAIRELTVYLRQICQDLDTSILLIHHDRKRSEEFLNRVTSLDDVYGSRFLSSDADYVIAMGKGEQSGTIIVKYVKMRLGPQPEDKIIKRTSNLNFIVEGKDDQHNDTGSNRSDDASGDFRELLG